MSSGRGLCDGLITRPEESYRLSLCVIKKPRTRGGYSPARGLQNTNPQWVVAPVEKKKVSSHHYRTLMVICMVEPDGSE